ncbi:hypothetical protein RND81_06G218200 [Saponaria officinalis]|uniref:Uncharacterized protein n=1 Tax=Saponaria officinalis TaxID=3572 RepID=A0AAW1K9S2_SAPOF
MAYYAEEDEVWKCTQHPSKRRRFSGVCPFCLTERLSALCPDCANLRPCSCSAASYAASTTSSAASTASSTFSLHFSDESVGRVSNLLENEAPLSRRAAFPFFRSARFSAANPAETAAEEGRKSSSLWSVFWRRNSVREKMTRSRSVADGGLVAAPAKGKGWYFPSPMKVFRHVKAAKVAHERSPMRRC